MSKTGKSIVKDLKKDLREFVRKLRQDEPIEVTEVRRVDTPDGPMHIRRKIIL